VSVRFLAAVAFVWALALAPVAQDLTRARELLQQALDALKPPAPTLIATEAALDAALATAAPGAVLALDPALVYTKALALRQAVTLQSAVREGQIDRATPLPSLRGGLTISGDQVTLIGVEVRHTYAGTDIVVVTGKDVTLERVRVLGDPVKGAKRGIAANSNGNLKVLRSFVADIFQPAPGADSQAVAAWDMAPGLLVEDSYLEASGETVMFGGTDAPEDRTPADIVIRRNTITKNPAWFGQAIVVKNLIELKNAKRVLFENNVCSYSWVQAQTGFLLVLTVRNQDGRAPWATIQDVTFRNNRWTDGATAIQILGRDDIKETRENRPVPIGTVRPSVPMQRVTISGDTFAIDPERYGKGNTNMKAIQIGGGPIEVTLDHVTITSVSRLGASVYFTGPLPAVNLTLRDVTLPPSKYGLFGEGTTAAPTNVSPTNPAWVKWTTDSTLANVTVH
jgi:hypothetical protein